MLRKGETARFSTPQLDHIDQIRLTQTQLRRVYSQSQLYKNQNKENVICENFKLNEIRNSFYSFQLKNSMEKYWCGDMFSKPSGLFTPPVEENHSETKGQLISKEILVSYEHENFNFSPKGGLISESL